MKDARPSASSVATVRRLVAGIAVLLAALPGSLLAAGCGSSSSQAVAQVETTATTTTTNGQSTSPSGSGDPAAYAACMRRHGVPNFPDPEPGAVGIKVDKALEESPNFKAAANACKSLRPAGGPGPSPQQQAEATWLGVRYAACMRKHGVPDFPDPVVTADGRFNIPPGVRVDEDSPRFRAAAEACKKLGRAAKGALGGPVGGRGSTP